MSQIKSLKSELVKNLKQIIRDSKEKNKNGELDDAILELDNLVDELEEQLEVERIMRKQ